ncbi:PREDICTED: uncharacterized protein LOC109210464 [Nicotiana attenuata]|uniref:uncharacterized protein LOC109210464 n=1 Tax=Nicotiana attenuata TaxID=49451 RepID=UPI000905A431|nr:PREDICTED: uncharacterized protein LOC109210464 [Nicotiana attenuata]
MKLNPESCAFWVSSGKFLGFMVSNRGIEINPKKINIIEDITVVDNIKAIQRPAGRIAALGQFISRLPDKSHQFFSLLKKRKQFFLDSEMPASFGRTQVIPIKPPFVAHSKDKGTIVPLLGNFRGGNKWCLSPRGRRSSSAADELDDRRRSHRSKLDKFDLGLEK